MNRRWRRLAVAAAFGVAATGCATTPPPPPVPPTAALLSGAAQPIRETLPNGLALLIQDHRAADIVAAYLWVGTGVFYETPDGLGYAHFQEHMLFKGTDKFGPGYIDRVVEGQGGRDNAFTSFDYTTFQITAPSDGTKTAIELLDDMAFRSTFDPKEITAEREVIFEEARIEQDNPKTAIIRQLYGLVFTDHPYGRPVLGTPETMNAATQEKLKAFNRQYYTPENMALVVVGPVQAKTVRAMVDRTFGRERRTGYAPPSAPPLSPIKGMVRRTVERPEQQAHLALGWQAPSLSNPDSFPLDLLSTILAGSESSRMAKTLRDGERIVASISMTNSSLQLAVTKAESEHAFSYETSDGVASAYGLAQTMGKLEDELRYLERLRTVTREQIRDAARKYLPLSDYARIAFVPGKAK